MLEDYLVPGIWVNQHYYKHIDWNSHVSVLSGGVFCSKERCRRFGRIFGRCRLFEIIDNILNETLLSIRWPINRSNRFSNFLRLDRLDRFGKIVRSIFSKFWKREFQFFSDFQNFFGFLKFREKCFFGIYSKFPVEMASVVVANH